MTHTDTATAAQLLTILPILPVNDQQCRVINIVLPNNGTHARTHTHFSFAVREGGWWWGSLP